MLHLLNFGKEYTIKGYLYTNNQKIIKHFYKLVNTGLVMEVNHPKQNFYKDVYKWEDKENRCFRVCLDTLQDINKIDLLRFFKLKKIKEKTKEGVFVKKLYFTEI